MIGIQRNHLGIVKPANTEDKPHVALRTAFIESERATGPRSDAGRGNVTFVPALSISLTYDRGTNEVGFELRAAVKATEAATDTITDTYATLHDATGTNTIPFSWRDATCTRDNVSVQLPFRFVSSELSCRFSQRLGTLTRRAIGVAWGASVGHHVRNGREEGTHRAGPLRPNGGRHTRLAERLRCPQFPVCSLLAVRGAPMRIRIVLLLLTVPVAILSQTPSAKQESEMLAKAKELYGDRAPKTITFVTLPRPPDSAAKASTPSGSSAGAASGAAGSGSAASSGGAKTQPARFNAPGDTATGAVLQEEGDQAFVDASPCNGRVMVFTQPYTKSATTPTTCGDKQIAQYRFVQQ